MTREIDLRDRAQAERISILASHAPYEVYLSTDTAMLDARSLLGLMSLIGKRARVVAGEGADPMEFGALVERMQ